MSRKGKLLRKIYCRENRRGATAIIVAIVLIVLLGIAALAVDIGYLYAAKNELQNAADAAALAGARQLGDIYSKRSIADQETFVCGTGSTEEAQIKDAAIDVASKNKTATQSVVIDAGEVEIGIWDSDGFKVEENQPNAVRVTARRDGSTGATVGTFFARVLGIDDASVVARATAALTAQSTTTKGELELPVGISEYRLTMDYCNKPIKFSPTGTLEGCAGWHAFDEHKDANTIGKDILEGMVNGSYTSPATVAGTTIVNAIGGELGNAGFGPLADLLADRSPETFGQVYVKCGDSQCRDGSIGELVGEEWRFYDSSDIPDGAKPVEDKDGAVLRRQWDTAVIIYEASDCDNPKGPLKVVGYSTIELWCVLGPETKFEKGYSGNPPSLIMGQIVCDGYYDGRGGGSTSYGTKGTIPGLVE